MMKSILKMSVMSLFLLALCLGVQAQTNPYGYTEGAVLYSQTFESGASLTDFTQTGIANYTIEWLDYSAKTVYGGAGTATGGCEDLSGTTFVGSTIPSAPNTGDASTKAVRMYVNQTGTPGAKSTANLFTNTSFSGDYRMKVDMFLRVNGPADAGGTGSTQNAIVGVGHGGSTVVGQDVALNGPASDGYFFTMNSERGTGSTGDCVLYEGASGTVSALYLVNVLVCGDVDPATAIGTGLGIGTGNENQWLDLFPYGVDKWRYRGAPGDGWITMTIDSMTVGTDRLTIVYINNGSSIADITNYADTDATYPSGKIALGFEDRFSGSQNGADDSNCIFDNLKVYALEPPVPTPTPTPTPPPLGASNWSLYE